MNYEMQSVDASRSKVVRVLTEQATVKFLSGDDHRVMQGREEPATVTLSLNYFGDHPGALWWARYLDVIYYWIDWGKGVELFDEALWKCYTSEPFPTRPEQPF